MEDKTIQEVLHDFRKKIDACIKESNNLRQSNSGAGREISLCHTKLQEAKMWIGKGLEELGSKLPEEYRDETKGSEPVPAPEKENPDKDEGKKVDGGIEPEGESDDGEEKPGEDSE